MRTARALGLAGVLTAGSLVGACLQVTALGQADTPTSTAFFENRVRPVLIERCFSCHSAASNPVKAGLLLDTRTGMLKGGGKGAAINSADLDGSLFLKAIRHAEGAPKMPPDSKLKDAEIAALTAWVKAGAKWPEEVAKPVAPANTPGKPKYWAFIPPGKPALPTVKATWWIQNPIDRFVLAKLEAKGLKPAPVADRRTLIRRTTFDLIGLPPTPKEIADFLADTKPGAYARVIDRLLASPAYGEKWGRHWLDVARYADSNGVDENLVFTNAWRYRDYVVNAFNQNKPIDRFIHEQVAGDLLLSDPKAPSDMDRIIATGYLSLGPKMLAEDDPVKQEMDIIDEQIDTLGKTFLGITIGCARCHDHKFDPFPQTDYYALAGIFKSTKTMMNFKNMAEWQEIPLVDKAARERSEAIEKSLKEKKDARTKAARDASAPILKEANGRVAVYLEAARSAIAAEKSIASLTPMLGSEGMAPPAGSILIEAEDFVRGNVLKDRNGFGKGIGVLVNAGTYPNRAEYDINIPSAMPYQIDLRYASGDTRPCAIYVNGALITSSAAGKVTGGFNPDAQKWFGEAIILLKAGNNTIKLERESYFPHVDKLLLTPKPSAPVTGTLNSIASEKGLNAALLQQALEAVKKTADLGAKDFTFEESGALESAFESSVKSRLALLDGEIKGLEKNRPVLPRAMAVSDGKPTNLKVSLRGNYLTLGAECSRGFPVVLETTGRTVIEPNHSGRLEFAQWLTSKQNPLTARVFVNRVWRWRFGRGIVGSPDNFGTLGERPDDQQLLDYLATTFMESGWSLKDLHRQMMLSATYIMSSTFNQKAAQLDPENRLHWRTDRRRLDAEEIRDSLLAVSGTLDPTMGGSLLKFSDRQYVTSTANSDPVNYKSARRSLYLPVIRSALYDVYTAFDFGDPTVMNGDRSSTTVAPQALFMMNSMEVLDASKALADRLIARTDLDDSGRISSAFESCYGRMASSKDIDRLQAVLTRFDAAYTSATPDPVARKKRVWQSLCKSLFGVNEFIYVD
ncbi:MAG: DUF1553 domain-containing protein [Chthonomonadales bacterium]